MFRRMDDDGSKSLSLDEFSKGIRETGLELGPAEMEKLFVAFDADGSGSINIDEFLIAVRVMQRERQKIINGEQFHSHFQATNVCSTT